ncbi:hypothetical protein [Flammeovirga aprica]|uniref:Uncharacterized protein n=1 Tax=Flammeovirga aprica JL-4 TaxID=694437 RepID=A0A7X9RVC0_9BACT|nr:hypothetical protein [Flammeovirga aprica]NME69408.1 hypothetical protein [Flammeovirga aprica JL-4]
MKSITLFFTSLLLISNVLLADNVEDEKNAKRNYDSSNAPKIKTAPFSRGVGDDATLEIFVEGKHKMLIDRQTENILFDKLVEGKDFVRVYTDYTDGQKALIVWQAQKKKKSEEVKWKIYTYKYFPSLGWRPVDNRTTKVKSFK